MTCNHPIIVGPPLMPLNAAQWSRQLYLLNHGNNAVLHLMVLSSHRYTNANLTI